MLRIISLGAGVQSTVMALMAAKRELTPRPDAMIFADTKWEPKAVYENLDWLEGEIIKLTNGQMPLYRVSTGNIRKDQLNRSNTTGQRFASMPLYTANGGMERRQCTSEYKIDPINKKIRELMGLKKGEKAKDHLCEKWIGFTVDEMVRCNLSDKKWAYHRFPLIENNMHRRHCREWFGKHYPERTLQKSACIGCPFHNNAMWREMKMTDLQSWEDAVEFDHAMRARGRSRNMKYLEYLHQALRPLDEIDFRNEAERGQISFLDECEGMCGL